MPVGKQSFQVSAFAEHVSAEPYPLTCHVQEYCEECEDTGRLRTVNRSSELSSNAVLPVALQQRVGNRIYTGMRENFRVRCL